MTTFLPGATRLPGGCYLLIPESDEDADTRLKMSVTTRTERKAASSQYMQVLYELDILRAGEKPRVKDLSQVLEESWAAAEAIYNILAEKLICEKSDIKSATTLRTAWLLQLAVCTTIVRQLRSAF